MTLSVDIHHRQGDFELEAGFQSSGRLTALFGPSGSGKTTLVNLIAGLIRPGRGRIEAGGRVLADTEQGIFVPAHRRRIGYVFQDARLFPHLTVRQNLGYGRFFSPRSERYAEFDTVVDLLGIGHLLDRRPGRLSGGEKQRVAIGRALIASPRLILMDEPLASLDESRKAEIMPHIERLRDEAGIPIVYVSHSLAEVSRLATHIVQLSGGRVAASGPAHEVLATIGARPTALLGSEQGDDPFVLIELQVTGHEVDHGIVVLRSSGGEWRLAMRDVPVGARIRAKVSASDVIIATASPNGLSALNVLPAVIETIVEDGRDRGMVVLRVGEDRLLASVTARSIATLGLAPGRPVHAVVKSMAVDSMPMRQPRGESDANTQPSRRP